MGELDEYRRGLRMARALLREWLEVQPAYEVSVWDVLEVLDEAIEASSVDPCPVIAGVRGRDPVWMEWVVYEVQPAVLDVLPAITDPEEQRLARACAQEIARERT